MSKTFKEFQLVLNFVLFSLQQYFFQFMKNTHQQKSRGGEPPGFYGPVNSCKSLQRGFFIEDYNIIDITANTSQLTQEVEITLTCWVFGNVGTTHINVISTPSLRCVSYISKMMVFVELCLSILLDLQIKIQIFFVCKIFIAFMIQFIQ